MQKSEQMMGFEKVLQSHCDGLLKESNCLGKIQWLVGLVSKLLQQLLQGEMQDIKNFWNNQPN